MYWLELILIESPLFFALGCLVFAPRHKLGLLSNASINLLIDGLSNQLRKAEK